MLRSTPRDLATRATLGNGVNAVCAMVNLRVRPDQASDGDSDDHGDDHGCGCSREISRFARDSRCPSIRSIVRECVATRRFYDLKTEEYRVHVVSLRLRSWGLLGTTFNGHESHLGGRAWRTREKGDGVGVNCVA